MDAYESPFSICLNNAENHFSAVSHVLQRVSCTIHGTHKYFFLVKIISKLSPTALFTHLNIILIQCFQFSAFSNKRYPSTHLFSFLIGAISYSCFDSISIFERFINLLATQPWWMGVWPNNPWAIRGLRLMLKALS